MIIILFLEEMQWPEIKNKLSEFNLFYKYLTQERKVLISNKKIMIILQVICNIKKQVTWNKIK